MGTAPRTPLTTTRPEPPNPNPRRLSPLHTRQTVINDVFQSLVPAIAGAAKLDGVIDTFTALGGSPNWRKDFPLSCKNRAAPYDWAPCANWCDGQSCDQCHPDNDGYVKMAATVMKGLGL
jgi:hypothetical protein